LVFGFRILVGCHGFWFLVFGFGILVGCHGVRFLGVFDVAVAVCGVRLEIEQHQTLDLINTSHTRFVNQKRPAFGFWFLVFGFVRACDGFWFLVFGCVCVLLAGDHGVS